MVSCGNPVSLFGGGDSLVAVVAVAVADVAGERVAEGVPVEVVGVGDDELGQRGEVALDRVDQPDPARFRPNVSSRATKW